MKEKNMQEINIDEIMEKIREELARKRAEASREEIPQKTETKIWRFLKKLQDILHKHPSDSLVYRTVLKLKKYIPRHREYFLLEDFLKRDGEVFITHAYSCILKRTPDPEGLHLYLTKLNAHTLNKIQILGALRYSKEGRSHGVKIRGLFVRYAMNASYRIPVAGRVLRVATAVVQLPVILKNIELFNAYTEQEFAQTTGKFAHVYELLLTKADVRSVDALRHELANKADVRSVHAIREDIETNIMNRIEDNKLNILNQQKSFSLIMDQIKNKPMGPAAKEPAADMGNIESHLLDSLYVSFENRFRGTSEDIKERLKVYLPYMEKAGPDTRGAAILDIGCGRGEWLNLLKEHGYHAKGIDRNRIMIDQCRRLGLDAVEADVLEYLKSRKSETVDVITGFHIVEHLRFGILINLFDECFRTLKPGGMMIFETPNPENLIVGACNFYTDPTHLHPLPPDTLRFLAEQRGFSKTEVLKLHKLQEPDYTNQKFVDELLYRANMEQDYSLIGHKV